MNQFAKYFPWGVLALAMASLTWAAWPASSPKGKQDLINFSKLPVVDGGRVKPLDSVARVALMTISGKATFHEGKFHDNFKGKPKYQPAIKWLLDVMAMGPRLEYDVAVDYEVFRIDNLDVLNLLNLKPRPGWYRYSMGEIGPRIAEVEHRAKQLEGMEEKDQTLFDKKLLELASHLNLFLSLAHWRSPHAVPPSDANPEWQTLVKALGAKDMTAVPLLKLLMVHRGGFDQTEAFNEELASYQKDLDHQLPEQTAMARFEVFFNKFAPFYQCAVLYFWVFLLACVGWLGWTEPLHRAGFWLAIFTFVVHTSAIVARIYLSGRPPVTNLYSSAVFIGWGCVGLGLFLEFVYRNGLGLVVASVTGGLTLIVAHYLGTSGDTLETLQAVLDTNFWLSTHVVAITLGYTAAFVAGFLGIAYVLLGVFTPMLQRKVRDVNPVVRHELLGVTSILLKNETLGHALVKMIYGVVCFATLLSFVGTVLGGIWADQSWGRFWGWDPKENGALMIVLWSALILHARWAGVIKQRGLATMAIGGNIVTAWSWFGVNMLGVGLHAYGFMSGAVFWLVLFVFSQLVLIGIGLLPMHLWSSHQAQLREAQALREAPPPREKPGSRPKARLRPAH
jgi:cytochrome c-type biogenesis protein CcsB